MSDITIRNATLADAPRILEIYAYYVEHTVITFEYDVPSLAEFEDRMRAIMQKYPYLVIERDGRIEGYAYAHAFVGRAAYDWAAELTIYLDHDARRGGMGRVLYEALADRLKAMGIGMHRFGLVVLLPLLYALVLGGILSFPKFGILKFAEMDRAAKFMPIAMLVLLTKIGLGIGPNLEMLLNSGWALIMQEFGHFFGTLIFGLPVALLLGMKREAIGACYSIDREPNVAIIGEKYGLDSPEGRGVMGMYICGTVFGALWISILAGVVAGLDIFHPHSLAMGAGIGSASMMAAGTGSIIAAYPEAAETVGAYAAAANLMTSVLGIYFALFISLPVTVKIYELVTGDKRAA